ncbi:PQQ-like beta-propeller repeat protein [bacterium]|nr:PQQ-like beta-propeller repeat protein [bacterium]
MFSSGAGTNTSGKIGVYDATTGATIDASRVTGLRGNVSNDFDVNNGKIFATLPLSSVNSEVGVFNATTGSAINSSLFAPAGPWAPGLAATDNAIFFSGGDFVAKIDPLTGNQISGFNGPTLSSTFTKAFWDVETNGDRLYVAGRSQNGSAGSLSAYSATDGHLLSNFSTTSSAYIALSQDGNYLYNSNLVTGKIELFNALTGALITSSLVTTPGVKGLAVFDGALYVSRSDGTIGEYNALTGSVISATLISGLVNPASIVVTVPEVTSFYAMGTLVAGLIVIRGIRFLRFPF